MKPTLMILAAGMGSRYGGTLKQMDGIGPNNEAILDYSVYDAIRAGFGKVVFVIRNSFSKDFIEIFNKEKFNNLIEVEYVYQELDKIPSEFAVPEGREKPWGTNHAVLMGADVIKEPFAVINADDFYGREAFQTLADQLKELQGKENQYCMVGYKLENTMSDFGSVSRGVCVVDDNNNLMSIDERTEIVKTETGASYRAEDGSMKDINVNTIVSMNMFGFTPDYFEYSKEKLNCYLKESLESGNLKSEYLMPKTVSELINQGKVTLKVLHCDAKWFGVTYQEDKPNVIKKINQLVEAGMYPANLWGK